VGMVAKTFSQIITFTRASSATYFDAAGVLQTATTDVPRFDYDPSTLAALGLLIEESRTNGIRNNTMQGAVAGTPGTLPTNWVVVAGGLGTLTQQVVGTGTSAGITYIDIRLSGTTSTTSVGYSFESATQIVAAQNQVWASTFWAALQAGSLTNISTIENRIIERDAVGANLGSTVTDFKASFTSVLTRTTTTRTLASASAARITNDVTIAFSSGAAIDITLRIGLPQLELGAFATSVIPTTTTAVTRAADVASVNTLSPWYNAAEGTLFAESSGFATNSRIVSFSDNSNSNRIHLARGTGSGGNVNALVTVSGAAQVSALILGSSLASGVLTKAAFAYKQDDFAGTVNGGTVVTDTTGTIPTVTQLMLGNGDTLGANVFNGYLRRITYYPRKLSSAELQSITT
jgi:hypothetical protein